MSIYESFNARSLLPSQVAQTFVPSDHYWRLCRRNHATIVGPRGSGKTTLLKMLQQPALENWDHEDATRARSLVDFVGIFVSTDISWSEQLRALGESKSGEVLVLAAFTTHVLKSLVRAFVARVGRGSENGPPWMRALLDSEGEYSLVRSLSTSWKLDVESGTFESLGLGLTDRLLEIGTLGEQVASMSTNESLELLRPKEYLYLPLLESVLSGIERFNLKSSEPDRKWALLFDELELAPKRIRAYLLRALRSRDEKLIFKLALSPYADDLSFRTEMSAAAGQDFEEIPLWSSNAREIDLFCREMWTGLMRQREMSHISPEQALGVSVFTTPRSEWSVEGTAYRPDAELGKRFFRLSQHDRTFREYLRVNKINVSFMHRIPADYRAKTLRKVSPLIPIREFYRSPDDSGDASASARSSRSRKKPAVYSGAESFFRITEGNPRWLIGMLNSLLGNRKEEDFPIPDGRQADIIEETAGRLLAGLRALKVDALTEEGRVEVVDLVKLLEKIGALFSAEIVRKPFKSDPAGTFIVDRKTRRSLQNGLERALNAGAVVLIDTNEAFVGSIENKRCRLCYLLAAHFGMSIRLERAVALSKLLDSERHGGRETQLALAYDAQGGDKADVPS